MTSQRSFFLAKWRVSEMVSQYDSTVVSSPVTFLWLGSLKWVNFSRDYLYIAALVRDECQTHPSYRWAQIMLQNRTSAVEPPKGEWDSLVLAWTGWQKVLGQGVGIIAKQLLARAVVMHHLTLEQELLWDPGVGTRVSLQRAAPCAHSPALTDSSATCPARLAWFTRSLTHSWPLPEGKCDRNSKNLGSPTWDNRRQRSLPGARGCQHCPGAMDCGFQLSYILTVDACP